MYTSHILYLQTCTRHANFVNFSQQIAVCIPLIMNVFSFMEPQILDWWFIWIKKGVEDEGSKKVLPQVLFHVLK